MNQTKRNWLAALFETPAAVLLAAALCFALPFSDRRASGVTLRFSAKCPEIMKFQVERDLNRQIKLIFDKNNINIPFTQIVVHKAKTVSEEKMADAQAAQKFIDEQRNLSRGMDEDEGNQ